MPEIKKLINFSNNLSKDSLWKVLKELVGEYSVHVYKEENMPDLCMNRYYWGFIIKPILEHISDATDNITKDHIHAELGKLFKKTVFVKDPLTKELIINEITGEPETELESTTAMTKKDKLNYFENCSRWAYEFHGIKIPNYGEANSINKSEI
jgi:hypothetical protein